MTEPESVEGEVVDDSSEQVVATVVYRTELIEGSGGLGAQYVLQLAEGVEGRSDIGIEILLATIRGLADGGMDPGEFQAALMRGFSEIE